VIKAPPKAQAPAPPPAKAPQPQPERKPKAQFEKKEKKTKEPKPPSEAELRSRARSALLKQSRELALEQGLSSDYALMVLTGKWSLEVAHYRKFIHENPADYVHQKRAAGRAELYKYNAWIASQRPLVKIQPHGRSIAILTGHTQYELSWNDQAEPESKTAILALLSQEDYDRWAPSWGIDLELAARKLEVPRRPSERARISIDELSVARIESTPRQVTLLNGVILEGYVRWNNDFTLRLSANLDKDSPKILIPFHGMSQVRRVS